MSNTTFMKYAMLPTPSSAGLSCTVDSRYLDLAYLEVKIWSLPKHENLTTGKKIYWKRGEIAPKEQFLLFSTIFSNYL